MHSNSPQRIRSNPLAPILILCICLVCQVASVILLKRTALSLQHFSLIQVATNPFYLTALCFLGVQALLWPLVLRRLPLFLVYSLMVLSYPGILLASFLVFHESPSLMNLLGAALIIFGVVTFAVEGKRPHG